MSHLHHEPESMIDLLADLGQRLDTVVYLRDFCGIALSESACNDDVEAGDLRSAASAELEAGLHVDGRYLGEGLSIDETMRIYAALFAGRRGE